jgi:hypothetical protein
MSTILSKYSHLVSVSQKISDSTEVELDPLNVIGLDYIIKDEGNYAKVTDIVDGNGVYAEFYTVYSSRRNNPTGRGKVGWSLGAKVTNSFRLLNEIDKSLTSEENETYNYKWSDKKGPLPYRVWASFEYDLRKNLKFVGSAWADNGNKSKTFSSTIDDFLGEGENAGAGLIFDSPVGKETQFDFDFGMLYAVNENFRIGVHFQQPYIDIYWKFFEF